MGGPEVFPKLPLSQACPPSPLPCRDLCCHRLGSEVRFGGSCHCGILGHCHLSPGWLPPVSRLAFLPLILHILQLQAERANLIKPLVCLLPGSGAHTWMGISRPLTAGPLLSFDSDCSPFTV